MDASSTFLAVYAVIRATIPATVPLALGAMSGIVSERSGIVNIGIEGMMLAGAFAAFAANVFLSQTGMDPNIRLILAIAAALLVGAMMALLHATLSIRYKVDQIISGTVINIFAAGITSYLYFDSKIGWVGLPLISNPIQKSVALATYPTFAGIARPSWGVAYDTGLLYYLGGILFDKGILTYISLAIVPLLGFALFRTTWGLRTRAVGENPRAADTLGVNVHRLQYTNLAISGMLAGLAGAVLVLEGVSFQRGMTDGRGFIALAVMIFGMWRPSRAFLGALLFGFATALQGQLQFFGIEIPQKIVGMLPYALTLIVLAGFVGRARPPANVGQSYEVD